jgi:hypothetical protein
MEAEIDWSMVGLDNTSILSRLGTVVHTRQRDAYCIVAKAKIFKHSASVSSRTRAQKGSACFLLLEGNTASSLLLKNHFFRFCYEEFVFLDLLNVPDIGPLATTRQNACRIGDLRYLLKHPNATLGRFWEHAKPKSAPLPFLR